MRHEIVPDFKHRRVVSFLSPEGLVGFVNWQHGIVKAKIKI